MKKLLIIPSLLIVAILFGYNPKESKTPKEKRVTNNTSKTGKQLCAERGHQFDEDSTVYVPKNEAKTKSYIADYEDSTVLVTPIPYRIKRTCLRCGKSVTESPEDRREILWRKPAIDTTTIGGVDVEITYPVHFIYPDVKNADFVITDTIHEWDYYTVLTY